tara:strand:- start:389 stop:652 length:264 start_codon:yes stop_codon:yes gene_type:complete
MTPIQELIKQLKEERHSYMMQEHHPLELAIIEDCFDSAIWKAKDLLEKEKKLYTIEDIERCVENWGLCKVEKEYIERFLETKPKQRR